MRKEYDFSDAIRNPYVNKKQITIRIDEDIIDYFKHLAEETGISYQNLINMFLKDCVANKRTIKYSWD